MLETNQLVTIPKLTAMLRPQRQQIQTLVTVPANSALHIYTGNEAFKLNFCSITIYKFKCIYLENCALLIFHGLCIKTNSNIKDSYKHYLQRNFI